MLSLSDICEEEEEEDDDDDDVHEYESKDTRDDDVNGGLRNTVTAPVRAWKRDPDEFTRLFIGHPDVSFYPGDTCDSIGLTRSSRHSNGHRHRRQHRHHHKDVNLTNNSGVGGSDSESSILGNENGSLGYHRQTLGELHSNGRTAELREKTIGIDASSSPAKPEVLPLLEVKAAGRSDPIYPRRQHRRRGKPNSDNHHRPSSPALSRPKDTRNNHLPTPTRYNSSSRSPSSPCQNDSFVTISTMTSPNPGFNTNNSNHTDLGDGPDRHTATVVSMAGSEEDPATTIKHTKTKWTSICVLLDGGVRTPYPIGLTDNTSAKASATDAISMTSAVDIPSPVTTPSSENVSQSSSSSFYYANNHHQQQERKSDDVSPPSGPNNCSGTSKSYQTLIPIHEVKRGLTRKHIIQLSVMSGIGFIFVAFIILWLMSPVLF